MTQFRAVLDLAGLAVIHQDRLSVYKT
jgi:hypothetical protein